MKPRSPMLQLTRLFDQVRERIRYAHYSLSTEKTYLYWIKFFVRWRGYNGVTRNSSEIGSKQTVNARDINIF